MTKNDRRGRGRATEPALRDTEPTISRRTLVRGAAWTTVGVIGITSGLGGLVAKPAAAAHHERAMPSTTLLERSPFVYISPLRADGSESTCHAELWYAWLDESIVVTVASDRWKASALAKGLDRARIWVGDHGRWKTWYGGTNEDFRDAAHFDARAERVTAPGVLDRLLAAYETKYPAEIADWRDIMRTGNADGSRIVIRYTPLRS